MEGRKERKEETETESYRKAQQLEFLNSPKGSV